VATGHSRDHAFNVVGLEAIEHQGADIGETNPGRLELRSESEQRKDRQVAQPLDRQVTADSTQKRTILSASQQERSTLAQVKAALDASADNVTEAALCR
jgi:multidrug efflux pump subunit AcrA (membrane-fusion protein)